MVSELTAAARAVLEQELTARGFTKRAFDIYTYDIDASDGIAGHIGIPWWTHRESRSIETDPVVGIHDPEVERIVAMLRGQRYRRFRDATVRRPLSQLFDEPRFRTYAIVHDGAGDREAVARMVRDFERYGIPFITANSTRPAALRTLSSQGMQNDLMFRVPALLLLLGDARAAQRHVEKMRREYADVTRAARDYGYDASDYDLFAARFSEFVNDRGA